MFIATEHGDIALRTVVRITHCGREGHQYAITDDGERHRIVGEDEVLRVTGTIVPASSDEIAYLGTLRPDWRGDIWLYYQTHSDLIARLRRASRRVAAMERVS